MLHLVIELVVSGKEGLSLFCPEILEKGYILLCPTHPRQPIDGGVVQNLWEKGDIPRFVFTTINDVKNNYPINDKQIFLSGAGFGGGGAWGIACANPGKFAGLGVINGYTYSLKLTDLGFNFYNLKGIPIYFIHGEIYKSIPVQDARMTAQKCQSLHLIYKYVELKGMENVPNREILKMIDWFDEKVLVSSQN